MNTFETVGSVMTDHKHLITVSPEDNLLTVKEIFINHKFHHIPVVHFREIVGIVSKSDFQFFMGGASHYDEDKFVNELRLQRTTVKEIMVKKLGKVETTDRLNVAIEIFLINRFHALPVVDEGELVGMITPFDILSALATEKPADPSLVYEHKSL